MQKSFFKFVLGLFIFVSVVGVAFGASPRNAQAFCAKQVVDPFQLVFKCKDKKKSKPAPKPAVNAYSANGANNAGKVAPVKIVSGYCYPENINEVIGSSVMWRVVTADSQGINVGGSVQDSSNRSYLTYPGYFYEWKGMGASGTGTGVNAFHLVQNTPYVALTYNTLGKKTMSVKVSYAGSSINIACTPSIISGNVGAVSSGGVAHVFSNSADIYRANNFNSTQGASSVVVDSFSDSPSFNSNSNYSGGIPNNSKDIERAMNRIANNAGVSGVSGLSNASSLSSIINPTSSSAQTAAAIFSLNGVPWIIVLVICAFVLFGLIMYIMMGKK